MNQNLDPKKNSEHASTPGATAPESPETEVVETKTAADGGNSNDLNTSMDTSTPESKVENTDDSSEKSSSMTGFVVGAIVLALLMIGGVWYFMSGTNVMQPTDATGGENAATVADILGLNEGEPDDPVAKVNGEVLTRAEYNRMRQQLAGTAQQQGLSLSASSTIEQINTQAMDTLVETELLRQAAATAGREVSETEVDERFNEIVEQVGGADALAATLEEINLTEASLRSDVKQEILVQGYIDTELEGKDMSVTDEEIQGLYDEAGGADAGLPPLEEVRVQIEQQIEANKRNEAVGILVDALREGAEVEVLI
jgi:peptidyl-prolyl cis-trans isomerase SurA